MVTTQDIPALLHFIKIAPSKLYSLQVNKEGLTNKVELSVASFKEKIKSPSGEYYFFIMQDTVTNAIVGCSAVKASVGINSPFYLYHISKAQYVSQELNYHHTVKFLELNNDFDGSTEICSLYLLPEYRHHHNGRLLSYARLLFIANFPERFSSRIFADIRGVCHNNGQPPFWRHVIKPFIPMSFAKEERLMGLEQRQFIADLMPKFPIYIDLLPTAAQKVIGVTHPDAIAAKTMLEQENFHHHDYVNVLDAGPTVSVFKSDLRMMNESSLLTINKIEKNIGVKNKNSLYLISNNKLDFRAVLQHIYVSDDVVALSTATADALQVEVGDKVMCRKLG
jgi:arginine N-succinyltransferase